MAINQVVAGAAALTSSATAFSASVPGAGQTFAVASDAGYPVSGRFVVQLNRGESDEEKVLVSSRSGTTFTVETRGYDGTTAQSHTNPTVNLILPATVVNALIDHADDNEADPHSTKLLNNTRHDTTSRHALGTVIPTTATLPVAIAPDDTGSAGSANSVARSDHRHAITTATAVAISTASAEGAATSFARSDHTHAIPTDLVTADMAADGIIDALAKLTSAMQEALAHPVGSIVGYGAAAAPAGWTLCDGSAISRSTFSALFAVIGTTYGAGNGSTTFNVPDYRGRFMLGKAASGTGSTLGGTGGTIDHVHDLDSATSHAKIEGQASGSITPYWLRKAGMASWTATISTNAGGNAQASSIATTNGTGLGGDTDTANPPFQASNFIIKH